ncbi:MAG: methionyl-tRNA formyltransferase [Oligoflexia bacterium]|nr:methionyl-tRNA formyltransferase [Oligoflexia bacterium]
MKIAFLGTPEISAYVLGVLSASGHDIRWAASQPDKKAGRGMHVRHTPVKEKAISLGIPVLQAPVFNRDFFNEIKKHGDIDLAVVVAYGLYIPTYFVTYPGFSCLNIHLSVLPLYRGAAPVARAIMDGRRNTGVTIMKIAKEMDAGDIVASREFPVDIRDTTETLTWKLVREGTSLLLDTVGPYTEGRITPVPQDKTGIVPCFAEKLSRDDAAIDWAKDAVTIHNTVRALNPWPGVYVKINGVDVKIKDTLPVEFDDYKKSDNPGTICYINTVAGNMLISTGRGCLLVEKVQPSGKKEMSVPDFVNGYRIKTGMRVE